jgi:hypothetical protein
MMRPHSNKKILKADMMKPLYEAYWKESVKQWQKQLALTWEPLTQLWQSPKLVSLSSWKTAKGPGSLPQ